MLKGQMEQFPSITHITTGTTTERPASLRGIFPETFSEGRFDFARLPLFQGS